MLGPPVDPLPVDAVVAAAVDVDAVAVTAAGRATSVPRKLFVTVEPEEENDDDEEDDEMGTRPWGPDDETEPAPGGEAGS